MSISEAYTKTVQQYRRADEVFSGDFIRHRFEGDPAPVWVKVIGTDEHDKCCRRLLVRDRGVSRFVVIGNSNVLDVQRD